MATIYGTNIDFKVPSLDLRFADRKNLVDTISGKNLIDFSRSSSGTYVGSDGLIKTAAAGEARFDHDPVTGESLGLLVEEARTNSIWPSEPSTASARNGVGSPGNAWGVYDGTVSSASRNGIGGLEVTISSSLDANGFTGGGSTSWGGIGGGGNHAVNANARVSFFINPLTWTGTIYLGRLPFDGNNTMASRNLLLFNNGVYVGNAAFVKHIFSDGTYWLHNISWTSLSAGIATSQFLILFTITAGDNSKKFWAGGFQWEAGSFSTSYIPASSSTVTRAADVATLTNNNIYNTDAFTITNEPFGASGGSSTLSLVGPNIKRTSVYSSNLSQATINKVVRKTDEFWRWRVTGSSFGLPGFTTDGQVTVDWGDGTVETLTTSDHTFTDGKTYHEIGFRLDSGTYFRPYINNESPKTQVVAIGPAPESMIFWGQRAFRGCINLEAFDATVDATGGTLFNYAWDDCSSLTSFPLIDTSSGVNFEFAWYNCNSLTSFPLIDTSSGTSFEYAWFGCNGLTSFPLIDTSSGINFQQTWRSCSSLTRFPLIDTSSGTNFYRAWRSCSGLTSFPLIDMSSGTNFQEAWFGCNSLISFPTVDVSSGTNFRESWRVCSSLTSFPALNLSSGTNFYRTWEGCGSLTSFPLIDMSSGTNFQEAWKNCINLTDFSAVDISSGTNFQETWRSCSSLTSFPLIDTSSGTNFRESWYSCASLTSFPLIDTSSGTNFSDTWFNCNSLTSFPLIDTSSGTTFNSAWYNCTSLTSFPLIDTSSGTNFFRAWRSCTSLTSFPSINTSNGTTFYQAWFGCTSLTSFPANFFDSWTGTPGSNCFFGTWENCYDLTAASVENILNSIDTSGQSAPASGVDITIDYDTGTGTPSIATAVTNLKSRGWTITLNGAAQ